MCAGLRRGAVDGITQHPIIIVRYSGDEEVVRPEKAAIITRGHYYVLRI